MRKIISIIAVSLLFISCSKEWAPIKFFTTNPEFEFYVDGEILNPENPGEDDARFFASNGGKETVSVDYYGYVDDVVYTSMPNMAEILDPGMDVFVDDAINLTSSAENIAYEHYSVSIDIFSESPSWRIFNMKDYVEDPCFVGQWRYNICGDFYEYIRLSANGTGVHELEDCTGTCSIINEFKWTESNGILTWAYTYAGGCGVVVETPSAANLNYECIGNFFVLSGKYYEAY